MAFSFKGGIHPEEHKQKTKDLQIVDLKAPEMVYIPLLQHIGAQLDPLVKVGDMVKKGQKIADKDVMFAVPVHASVSGQVVSIKKHLFPLNGKVDTIIIKNDFKETEVPSTPILNYLEKSKDELLHVIREAGVVGKGGAAFPTHIKLNPPSDKVIDALIINGAECEPYLTPDYRCMIEAPEEIIEGIEILLHVTGVKQAYVGIELNKPEAIKIMSDLLKEKPHIKICPLKTKYPQGGEKQLIKAILNRVVPTKKLPSDVGVIVQNIVTAKVVYNAVILGKPLTETIVTLSGNGYGNPANVRVKLGTYFKELVEFGQINRDKTEKMIMGGPMMGIAQYCEETPVIKGTTGLLALTEEEIHTTPSKACISCGKCITACPMNLHPLEFVKLVQKEVWLELETFFLSDCMDCGSCAFVCPANRPLLESIKLGKAKLRELSRK